MANVEWINDREFKIRDAKIGTKSKNFSGLEKRNPKTGKIVNSEGRRMFCLEIPDEMVDQMLADNWKIKQHVPYENSTEEPGWYLPVDIGYGFRPPMVWLITDKRGKKVRRSLDENGIDILDKTPAEYIKVAIRGQRKVNEDTGEPYIKAWLSALQYHAANTDPFAYDDDFDFEDEDNDDIEAVYDED